MHLRFSLGYKDLSPLLRKGERDPCFSSVERAELVEWARTSREEQVSHQPASPSKVVKIDVAFCKTMETPVEALSVTHKRLQEIDHGQDLRVPPVVWTGTP